MNQQISNSTKLLKKFLKVKNIIQKANDENVFDFSHHITIENFSNNHPNLIVNGCVISNCGAHAGGTLILDHPEREMPVISVRGEYQSPWVEGLTEKTLESNGFLKFDLLGLKTLRAVQRCIEYILQSKGIEKPTFKQVKEWYDDYLHPDKLKMVKSEVFDNVYGQGKFPNLFQFTSRGAQSFIEKFEPKSVIDIAVATSIYRPGPLGAHVDKLYLECKNDKSKIKYKNSLILEVLKETSGCIVFQESVMALANKVGGFSLDDSDKVRKALMKRTMNGKDAAAKKQQELGKKFIEGAMTNGLNKHEAEEIWGDMLYFSGYGFNKCLYSHQNINVIRNNESRIIPIKDVKIGDLVRTRDESSENCTTTKVCNIYKQGIKKLVKVTLKTGETVKCTLDHKFRTTCGQMLPLHEILKKKLSIHVLNSNTDVIDAKNE